MQTNYAFLCEGANVSVSRTVNAFGIFESICGTQLPVACPRMTYVASIKGGSHDIGVHEYEVHLTNKQGDKILAQARGTFEITNEILSPMILVNFVPAVFHEPTIHYVKLFVDGKEENASPVNIVLTSVTFANFGK